MNVKQDADHTIARIASAIGEPARVRILYSLLDGHARTATELAIIAEVTPSTASTHLQRLTAERLIKVLIQGKHRYYSLEDPSVARALEELSVVASRSNDKFVPGMPSRLREARTCYDHLAGKAGVLLHDSFMNLKWLSKNAANADNTYELTLQGIKACETLGINIDSIRKQRRRFAYACLDWSERQPHIGGALGAAILNVALKRKWVTQDLDSRALTFTRAGKREMLSRFGFEI